jgi:hypothetical protein
MRAGKKDSDAGGKGCRANEGRWEGRILKRQAQAASRCECHGGAEISLCKRALPELRGQPGGLNSGKRGRRGAKGKHAQS